MGTKYKINWKVKGMLLKFGNVMTGVITFKWKENSKQWNSNELRAVKVFFSFSLNLYFSSLFCLKRDTETKVHESETFVEFYKL